MSERISRAIVAICAVSVVVCGALVLAPPASSAPAAVGAVADDMVRLGSPELGAASVSRERLHTTSSADDPASPAALDPGTHTVWISVDSVTKSTTDDVNVVPANLAAATAFVARMNDYWNRESGGTVTIALGGFETRALGALCSVSSLFAAGRATDFGGTFASPGLWTGTNRHLLVMSRESCANGTAGQGSVGGGGGVMATGVAESATVGLAIAVHEFGHNLGLVHANASVCPGLDAPAADFQADCATEAYGDYLDVMGFAVPGSVPHISSPQLISLGYLHDYASLEQQTGTVQQTIRPLGATPGAGVRALRVTDPNTGDEYFVEYRTPDSADAASPEFALRSTQCTTAASGPARCYGNMNTTLGGVRVLRVTPSGTSVLAVGAIGNDYFDDHLDAGESFTDHDSDFRLTVDSLDPVAGAVVSASFGSSMAATTPVVTAPPAAAPVVTPAAAVSAPIAPSAVTAVPAVAPAAPKAATHLKIRLRKPRIDVGARPVVIATVLGMSRPTGTVTIYVNGKRAKTAAIGFADAGVRKIVLPRRTAAGKLVVTARFGGSAKAAASASVAKKLTVK